MNGKPECKAAGSLGLQRNGNYEEDTYHGCWAKPSDTECLSASASRPRCTVENSEWIEKMDTLYQGSGKMFDFVRVVPIKFDAKSTLTAEEHTKLQKYSSWMRSFFVSIARMAWKKK